MNKVCKVLLLAILVVLGVRSASATGWEQEYEGVMLQGFYWDSFEDTKWTNLTSQVDELSAFFDLIWVPNSGSSGYSSMGYMPQYWFQHESSFGTSGELRSMIKAFKEKGTGFIADVVINHRNGVNGWYDFPVETDHHGNTWKLGLDAICGNDEMAYASGQPKPTGAYDEGENFDGCRDLDHTNSTVQGAVKAYLDYLLNELGYVGFRYDMVKGFAAYYVGLYNASAHPTYSVGEYYDGDYNLVTKWIDGTIRDNMIQSGAFDFPLKFKLNEAFGYPSDFSRLVTYYNGANQPNGLVREAGFRRFSVTFIDNHDTYRDGGTKFSEYYTLAGNAFILCHPGTPCVFLPHWQAHKKQIKQLINVRKSVGIHNQSHVEVWVAQTDKYVAKVYGKHGDLFIKVGYGDYTPDGFNNNDIVASGEGYCVWSKVHIKDCADKIVPESDHAGFSVYVEKKSVPASWSDIYCYAWTNSTEGATRLTAAFPGEKMTQTVSIDGVPYYKFSFDSSVTEANLLFANGNGSQTVDITEVKGNTYYSFASTDASGHYTMTTLDVEGVETVEPISIKLQKSSIPASWGTVKLYAWDSKGTTLLDYWPGRTMDDVEVVAGTEYYTYTFPNTVTMVNLIFTDGSKQSVDIKGVTQTVYYAIGDEVDGKYAVETIPMAQGDGISICLEKNAVVDAWGKVCMYVWDNQGNPLLGAWPGREMTSTKTIDGREYYVASFEKDVPSVNVIFNKGGDSGKTADITDITTTTYFSMKEDFSYYSGTKGIMVFLNKKSAAAWSKVYFYAWNDDDKPILAGWPGTNITNLIIDENNEEYYYHTFPPYYSSINLIFNDGSNTNQTVDIKGITGDIFYALKSTTGKNIAVSEENTVLPTDIEEVKSIDYECVVYPNPCIDYLYINSAQDVIKTQLYNVNGSIVMQTQDACVDVRSLASGIYLYSVQLANGSIQRGKFVKR